MMLKSMIALLVVMTTLIAVSSAMDCSYTSKAGDKYNFAGMVNTTSYLFNTQAPVMTYYWNICDVAHLCATMVNQRCASCQISGGTWWDTGSLDSTTFKDLDTGKGATITYGNGKMCSNNQMRTTNIAMQCSDGPTTVVSAAESSVKCIYDILMTSKYACPGAGGSSSGGGGSGGKSKFIGGGWVFIILLLVGTVLYIGIGIGVNYKVRGLRGAEMFPNSEFWREFPGYIKDGVLFIKGKITGSGGSGGYQQV